ncbi:MAG: phosphate acyltransferase PlsX [Actinomycetota bacterium]|nr:phosphate acyltransferase PlsX [Actinomycetota bacterium]
MVRIALDAMGGDRAPEETVAGAVAAAGRGVEVVLVGEEPAIRPLVEEHGLELPVVHARQTIEMGEEPARAIREKKDASVVVAARMVKEKEAEGMVSAGSTGAALAAASLIIGRIPGVHRPAIATILPTPGSPIVLLDSGANPECRPEHLAQFGIMGTILAETYLGLERPRIGLLSIGEERGKGRELERATYALLEEAPIDFIGQVEGRDLATGKADVFVTDGFTGNVVLKTGEGTAQFIIELLGEAISSSGGLGEGAMGLGLKLKELEARLDYESSGGGHLVGTRGVVVIAHGSSSRVAVGNALAMAADGAERGLVEKLSARLHG